MFTISERMRLLMPDDFSDLHLCGWRVELGQQDPANPLVEGEFPWERGGVGIHGTVLKDPIDGLFKAWVVCTPGEETSEGWPDGWSSVANDRDRCICYFESTDGVKWEKPLLSNVSYGSHERTNLIFSSAKFGLQAYASVLVDPSNKAWPYEMFVLQTTTSVTTPPHGSGYHRYRSKDGKSWEWTGGPTTGCVTSDVLFVYKNKGGGYLGSYRTATPLQVGDHLPPWEDCPRRTCFRATSEDGIHWVKDDLMVIQRDEREHRDTQFMEWVPLEVPGGYLGTISVYHPIRQTLDTRIAASRDGRQWWFPDRVACVPNAPLGEYGGGMIWQSKDLHVQDGKLYMYYAGSEGAHRQVSETAAPSVTIGYQETAINRGGHFLPFTTALCRVSWNLDRVYALSSSAGGPTIGIATTKPQELAGQSLGVNLVTRPPKKGGSDEGYLEIELLDERGEPIRGFSRADCKRVRGDQRNHRVSWTGGHQVPPGATQARFYLKRVFLYGFEFSPNGK
jgi:hypothetical protein